MESRALIRLLRSRHPMQWALLMGVCLGIALLYTLSEATANTSLFARHYPRLLLLGAMIAVGLLGLICYQIWSLFRKLRHQVFGSRLSLKLVLIFALMAVLPGTLVYGVSFKFLSNSIESWFDVNVDSALTAGLDLGRTAFDSMLLDLARKGELMASELSDISGSEQGVALHRLREQFLVQETGLFSKSGTLLAFSSATNEAVIPDALPISNSIIRQIRSQHAYRSLENLPDKGLLLRVVVPVNRLSYQEDIEALQLLQPVTPTLAADAESVEVAWRGYQELLLARTGLKRIYGLNLTLALLLTLLTAIAAAILISERLSAPLGVLAEGTRAVGAGDFTRVVTGGGNDELGILIKSFNTMIRQLQETSAASLRAQERLAESKAYQDRLLSNLSAGVMVFDPELTLKGANPSAARLLEADLSPLGSLRQWPEAWSGLEQIAIFLVEHLQDSEESWEGNVERSTKRGERKFHFRGTRLPVEFGGDWVVVFDDITEIVQAQRAVAWAEVARRLAHEIKNPLTPIQLAADRLRLKLKDKLPEHEARILDRSTATIINQVDALKGMVADFSEFARSSQREPRGLDLNQLIREVMVLYETSSCMMVLKLDSHLPLIDGDGQRMRQVIHNLVQNAQDALQDVPQAKIELSTSYQGSEVGFTVRDNGPGFSEPFLAQAFEPYITTKSKGTGLGLPIVKKIVEEHQGRIEIRNQSTGGALVRILLPVRGGL